MGKKKLDVINVIVKMKMRFIQHKRRTIPAELDKFCSACEERLTPLSNVIGDGIPAMINVGYWLEGDQIDEERKIYIKRKGKYDLHIDWSECDKKVIKKGAIPYTSAFTWCTLPTYIEEIFGDGFRDEDEIAQKKPTYRLLENGCIVSFSKFKCRDAIYWDDLPHQMTTDRDINLNSVKGSYLSIGMTDIAEELRRFAAHVYHLERSMITKTCMGLWNLPFLRFEVSNICGRDAKYRVDKGYYLCEGCGQMHQEMFGRIRKIR